MKHITEEYGTKVNFLELNADEYKALEPFLLTLGVRSRVTMIEQGQYTIQAENVYKTWIDDPVKRNRAENELTGFRLECWKR